MHLYLKLAALSGTLFLVSWACFEVLTAEPWWQLYWPKRANLAAFCTVFFLAAALVLLNMWCWAA